MRGFPNQISDLGKIAAGLRELVDLVDMPADAKEDGVFGAALVLAHVIRGRQELSPEEYLEQQQQKSPSNQSFRTAARGLRELYRMLGFIDDVGLTVRVTPLGREAVRWAGQPINEDFRRFWRQAFWNLRCHDDDNSASHPYQVLLRLIARKHSIGSTKCALALEAHDDSPEELARIAGLADLTDDQIRKTVKVTKANWDNARKILLSVAKQLGDVVEMEGNLIGLARPGGSTLPVTMQNRVTGPAPIDSGIAPRRIDRTPRLVTPATIARVAVGADLDEGHALVEISSADAVRTARLRSDRLRRHQAVVQRLAASLYRIGARLYENPFDILALFDDLTLIFEIKTLVDDPADERDRVREALAQLCYYETFDAIRVEASKTISKVACFEREVSDEHRRFLQQHDIAVIWDTAAGFEGDPLPGSLQLGRGRSGIV